MPELPARPPRPARARFNGQYLVRFKSESGRAASACEKMNEGENRHLRNFNLRVPLLVNHQSSIFPSPTFFAPASKVQKCSMCGQTLFQPFEIGYRCSVTDDSS
jgi:hypothetical protein